MKLTIVFPRPLAPPCFVPTTYNTTVYKDVSPLLPSFPYVIIYMELFVLDIAIELLTIVQHYSDMLQ